MKLIDKDGKFLVTSLGSSKPGRISDDRQAVEILRIAIKSASNTIVGKIKQSRYLN
ncbi:MAG TPA: hypothetical protein VEC36_04025 [Patescibacteria group bacterium]|nr:hypothetical protein [Patescibacteria group bacterium]